MMIPFRQTWCALALLVGVHAVTASTDTMAMALYKDPSQPIPARVADLLSRMTLAEKTAQLSCALSCYNEPYALFGSTLWLTEE